MSGLQVKPKQEVSIEEVGRKVFGNTYPEIAEWCVKRERADKHHALPKGRVANVFVVMEPLSRLIIRHEQETTDVTTIPTYLGYTVPAILNTKFQSGAIRRQLLTMLHEWYIRNERAAKEGLGISSYTCAMRPYLRESREKGAKIPEEFEGYCGGCPNCLIFGYAVQEGGGYNVKSRVEGDLYVGVMPETRCVVSVTFNVVDDIAKTTYRPEAPKEARTGALYEYRMVEVGTPFVGKLALRDMTVAELLLTLLAVARTTRIGGRKTHFGEIKIHIPAILFSKYEVGSGYEIAHRILPENEKKRPTIEDVISKVAEYVNGFANQGILVVDRGLADKLRSLSEGEVDAVVLQAWRDARELKESLDMFVYKSEGTQVGRAGK